MTTQGPASGDEGLRTTKSNETPYPWNSTTLYHRDAEQEILRRAVVRACDPSPRPELTLITGSSGTGKTALACSLEPRMASLNGFFVQGKYDQLERPDNFQPFVHAVESLVNRVVERNLHEVMDAIRGAIDIERDSLLLDLIPILAALLASDGFTPSAASPDVMVATETNSVSSSLASSKRGTDAQKRLAFSLSTLVRTIASPEYPVVLFLDDLQWAGAASVDLLSTLLPDSKNPGLILLGSCRGDEVTVDHRLSVMLRELEAGGVTINSVVLENLSQTEVCSMLADMLDRSDDVMEPMSRVVHQQSGGNVLFVLWTLRALFDHKLIYLQRDRWSWNNMDELVAVVSSWDLKNLLQDKIRLLPDTVVETMKIASCLGCVFDSQLLQDVMMKPSSTSATESMDCDVQVHLETLSELGLMSSTRAGQWRFIHDQIQKFAYNLIVEVEKDALHLELGRRMWKLYVDRLAMSTGAVLNTPPALADELSQLVLQLQRGAHLLVDQDERSRVANLMLTAANRASACSAFALAATYLDLGMRMLSARHWRDEYYLSLNLFNAAAEAEYCLGNNPKVRRLLREILSNTRTPTDNTQAQTLSIYVSGSSNELQRAIDEAIAVLGGLGERLPKGQLLPRALLGYVRLKRVLRRLSNADILHLPVLHDPNTQAIVRLLVLEYTYAMLGRPMLSLIVSMRIVKHSLQDGLSSMSAVGFSTLGLVMCSAFGDIDLGIRYAELSLEILDRFGSKEWLPRTYLAAYTFCLAWTKPASALLRPVLTAHRVSLGTGDIETAMLLAAVYSAVALHTSVKLEKVYEDVQIFLRLCKHHQQETMAQFLVPNMQYIHNLLGLSDNPHDLNGLAMKEDEFLENAKATKNDTLIGFMLHTKLILNSYFHQFKAVRQLAAELRKYKDDSTAPYSKFPIILHTGLAYASPPSTKSDLKKAQKCLKELRFMSTRNPASLDNKVLLLEAVIDAANGKLSTLKFQHSIEYARKEKLRSEEALAFEHLADAYRRKGMLSEAADRLRLAMKVYAEWGAVAKVADVKSKLSSMVPDIEEVLVDTHVTGIIQVVED